MGEHRMADAGRLMDAITGLEAGLADTGIIERDPTFQDIDELKVEGMPMFAGNLLALTADADYLGMKAALGRRRNAEIAIFEFLPEATALEAAIARA